MFSEFNKVLSKRIRDWNKSSSVELCFIPSAAAIHLHDQTSVALELVETLLKYSIDSLNDYHDLVEIKLEVLSEHIEILIADTGTGLKPDSPLFELFHRSGLRPLSTPSTKHPLLMRAYELEYSLKAKIWVESKWKMGSVFHIELPLIAKQNEGNKTSCQK